MNAQNSVGPKVTKELKFVGTDNPRYLRTISLILLHPTPRKVIDWEAGCANGPDVIAQLRSLGLEVPCERIQMIDRDGKICRPGVYSFSKKDRRKIFKWMASRNKFNAPSAIVKRCCTEQDMWSQNG